MKKLSKIVHDECVITQIKNAHIITDSSSNIWTIIVGDYNKVKPKEIMGYKPSHIMWCEDDLAGSCLVNQGIIGDLSEHCEGFGFFMCGLDEVGNIQDVLGDAHVRNGIWVKTKEILMGNDETWGDAFVIGSARQLAVWHPADNSTWISKEKESFGMEPHNVVLSSNSSKAVLGELIRACSYPGEVFLEPHCTHPDMGCAVLSAKRRYMGYVDSMDEALELAESLIAATKGLDLESYKDGQISLDEYI